MDVLKPFGETNCCSICTQRHTPKAAVVWCPECEEALCQDCYEHHSISRLSKEHTTINLGEIAKLPEYATSVRKYCQQHDGSRLDLYCSVHEVPCCVSCINGVHKTCSDIKPLDQALENIKQSYSFETIEASLDKILHNYEMIHEYTQKSITKTGQQTAKCLEDIKRFRKEVDLMLDTAEDEARKTCQEFGAELIKKHGETFSRVDQNMKHTRQKRQELSQIKKSATNFQTHESLKILRSFVTEQREELNHLESGNQLNDIQFWVKLNKHLSTMLDTIECLTDLNQREDRAKLELKNVVPSHEKAFQHTMSSSMPGKTFTTRIKHKQTIAISHKGNVDISGCHILPDGQLILVNKRQRRLLFYDSKNNCIKSSKELKEDPFDVTVFDKTVVASICNSNVVAVFNLETIESVSFLDVPSWSWGVDVVNLDRVILRFPNKARFEIRDVRKGNVTQTIPVAGQYILYVAWFSSRIYCTNWESNQVYCYDTNGNLLWCFQDKILLEPMGITTDVKGNIYVAGSFSNNVVCISQSGKNHHVILDEKDGLNKPHAVHYQKESNQLLVCNRNDGKVTICQIE